jgi:beta-fructofuranosidase
MRAYHKHEPVKIYSYIWKPIKPQSGRGNFMLSNEQKHADHQESVLKAMEALTGLQSRVIADPHRLRYHFMAPGAWINDPNGMIYFKGEYHLFYQIHPFSEENGLKHWGHAKSSDLIHWEHLPIALAPSEEFEQNGCFSGSAVDHNGVFTVFYTGNVASPGYKKQVQCIATSEDGITFKKYAGNPIIHDFPELDGSWDFRDPKVWSHDGVWYMALGSGKDGIGNALLYRSNNLLEWAYAGVMAKGAAGEGRYWNCPDFFSLEGKDVLLASPGVSPQERDIRTNIYRIGQMNYETGRFEAEWESQVDYGPDFYAPQTLIDDRGRVILIGWMDMWWNSMPTQAYGWTGAMTVPRVVKLTPEGRLAFEPVPELQTLRSGHRAYGPMTVYPDGENVLSNIQGDSLEIIACFDLNVRQATEFGFRLRRSLDGAQETVVSYNPDSNELVVDRTKSGLVDGGISRIPVYPDEDSMLKLQLFIDRSSLELFANDGLVNATYRLYPDPDNLGLELFTRGGSVQVTSLDVWKVNSIWE